MIYKILKTLMIYLIISNNIYGMDKIKNLFRTKQTLHPKASMRRGLQEAQIKRIVHDVSTKFVWPKNNMPKFSVSVIEKNKPVEECSAVIYPEAKHIHVDQPFYSSLPRNQFSFAMGHEIAHQQQYLEQPFLFSMVYNAANPTAIQNIETDADQRSAFALKDAKGGITFFETHEKLEKEKNKNEKNKIKQFILNSLLKTYGTHPHPSIRKKSLIEIQKIIDQNK